jgi:8-oxo-dGTP pyrophosphatase MutT (NUDIX family)
MTGIRHLTASAVVFDEHDRVLLVHHNKLGLWVYPGGHIDSNEDPAQAAVREVFEETGVRAQVVDGRPYRHPGATVLPAPFTILEHEVVDSRVGRHHHIDLVYICRYVDGEIAPQLAEVGAAQWVPITGVAELATPAEMPTLVAHAFARAAKS